MDPQIIAGYRKLVLVIIGGEDTDDFLPLRDRDIDVINESIESLREMNPRLAEIIIMRFGLDGGGNRTLKAVGKNFGVHQERIRQQQAKAIRLLRYPTRSCKLRRLFRSVLERQFEELIDENRQMRFELSELKGQKNAEEAKARREAFPKSRSVDEIKLEELYLSVRAERCLERIGVDTLGKLLQKTESELLEIDKFGARSLYNVKDALDEHGFSLAKSK